MELHLTLKPGSATEQLCGLGQVNLLKTSFSHPQNVCKITPISLAGGNIRVAPRFYWSSLSCDLNLIISLGFFPQPINTLRLLLSPPPPPPFLIKNKNKDSHELSLFLAVCLSLFHCPLLLHFGEVDVKCWAALSQMIFMDHKFHKMSTE